jgi:hypothetical protein
VYAAISWLGAQKEKVMKPGESKADKEVIRDSKTAGQRDVRAHVKAEEEQANEAATNLARRAAAESTATAHAAYESRIAEKHAEDAEKQLHPIVAWFKRFPWV